LPENPNQNTLFSRAADVLTQTLRPTRLLICCEAVPCYKAELCRVSLRSLLPMVGLN